MASERLLVAQDKIAAQLLNFAVTRPDAKLSWQNSILFPTYASAASAGLLILYGLYLQLRRIVTPQHSDITPRHTHQGLFARTKGHVARHGGPVIFAFEIVRLIGCATLVFLSLALTLSESDPKPEGGIFSRSLDDIASIALSLSFVSISVTGMSDANHILRLTTPFSRSA